VFLIPRPNPLILTTGENVVIAVVPTITEFLPESGSVEVAEGDSVRLMCRATGKPDPVISWTHRPHQIAANVIISYLSQSSEGPSFVAKRHEFTNRWVFSFQFGRSNGVWCEILRCSSWHQPAELRTVPITFCIHSNSWKGRASLPFCVCSQTPVTFSDKEGINFGSDPEHFPI